jgi:CHAT domain-containing protein
MYSNSTRRDKTETTLNEVTAQLTQPYSIMLKMDDDNFNALFSRDLENRNHSYANIPHNILHFTGHGYYDFDQLMNSALALSQTDRLTLTQIIKLNLSSYDLACLCACETAITGNQSITAEYIGIVSAFLYAGVAKVVSTLWTVESVASAVLMVEFHHHRLTGKPENQALSEAKHWLSTAPVAELSRWYQQQMDALPDDHSLRPWIYDRLDELATMEPDSIPYENPYFWAAFTLTGL